MALSKSCWGHILFAKFSWGTPRWNPCTPCCISPFLAPPPFIFLTQPNAFSTFPNINDLLNLARKIISCWKDECQNDFLKILCFSKILASMNFVKLDFIIKIIVIFPKFSQFSLWISWLRYCITKGVKSMGVIWQVFAKLWTLKKRLTLLFG